jgi:DNA polymerase-3 subunit gamma/tau
MALVRVARLESLTDLSSLVQVLSSMESAQAIPHSISALSVKKKLAHTESSPPQSSSRPSPTVERSNEPAPVRVAAPGARVDLPTTPSDVARPADQALRAGAGADPPRPAGEAGLTTAEDVPGPDRERADERRPAPSGQTEAPPLDLATFREVWPDLVKKVGPTLGVRLVSAEPVGIEAPGVLVIAAKPGYNSLADACATEEAREKIEQCLQRLLHRTVAVRYERSTPHEPQGGRPPDQPPRRSDLLAADPMVQKIVELFEARLAYPPEYDDDPVPD